MRWKYRTAPATLVHTQQPPRPTFILMPEAGASDPPRAPPPLPPWPATSTHRMDLGPSTGAYKKTALRCVYARPPANTHAALLPRCRVVVHGLCSLRCSAGVDQSFADQCRRALALSPLSSRCPLSPHPLPPRTESACCSSESESAGDRSERGFAEQRARNTLSGLRPRLSLCCKACMRGLCLCMRVRVCVRICLRIYWCICRYVSASVCECV